MGVKERVKLARLIVALAEDDKSAVVKAYTEMGVRTKRMGKCTTPIPTVCVFIVTAIKSLPVIAAISRESLMMVSTKLSYCTPLDR